MTNATTPKMIERWLPDFGDVEDGTSGTWFAADPEEALPVGWLCADAF